MVVFVAVQWGHRHVWNLRFVTLQRFFLPFWILKLFFPNLRGMFFPWEPENMGGNTKAKHEVFGALLTFESIDDLTHLHQIFQAPTFSEAFWKHGTSQKKKVPSLLFEVSKTTSGLCFLKINWLPCCDFYNFTGSPRWPTRQLPAMWTICCR